jgi:hypothetical protein
MLLTLTGGFLGVSWAGAGVSSVVSAVARDDLNRAAAGQTGRA